MLVVVVESRKILSGVVHERSKQTAELGSLRFDFVRKH
jgi:hypothetical protein